MYSNSIYSVTGESSFFLTYELHSIMPDYLQLLQGVNISLAHKRVQNLVQLRAKLEKQWVQLNSDKEKYYNVKHKAKSYRIGDKV